MTTRQMNQYCKKLCEDIKLYYLKDFCQICESDNWWNLGQISMRNFVLSRQGWKKSDTSDDVFMFLGKHPIAINLLNDEIASKIVIKTAIEIAKAELIDEFDKKNEDILTKIVKCIENQDWMLPFIRDKKSFVVRERQESKLLGELHKSHKEIISGKGKLLKSLKSFNANTVS